jgi:hypothetical protein
VDEKKCAATEGGAEKLGLEITAELSSPFYLECLDLFS